MANASICCFQIPREKIARCYNSGAISAVMVTALEIETMLSRDPSGNRDQMTGICLAFAPFIGSALIHFVVSADPVATNFGACVGAGTALAIGLTNCGHAVGALTGALTATALAAARVRVIRPANNS